MIMGKPNRFYEIESVYMNIVIDLEEVVAIFSSNECSDDSSHRHFNMPKDHIGLILKNNVGNGPGPMMPPIKVLENRNINEEIKKLTEAWINYKLIG